MNAVEAIALGIIQGLTEFLPISSSGHLELAKTLFGTSIEAEESLFLVLTLHMATALSTVVVFRTEINDLLKGLIALKQNESTRFSLKILLSMLPAVLVGLFLQTEIESLFSQNLLLIGILLLVTALLLYIADKAKNTDQSVSTPQALILGLVQAVAILPGLSRSGSTIATAVLLGIDREKAARFSFLMVLPLIFGSMAKKIMDAENTIEATNELPLVLGFLAAFFTGILACKWMIALVKKSQLKYFSIYCFIIGGIAIAYEFF